MVWREEKGKKKLFLPNTSSLLHSLSSMCPLCYSRFQEFHQPKGFLTNPTAIPDTKGEASSLQNKIPQKRRRTIFISILPSPASSESRQMEQKSSLHCERAVAQKSQICVLSQCESSDQSISLLLISNLMLGTLKFYFL